MMATSSIRLPAECGVRTTLSRSRSGDPGRKRLLGIDIETGTGKLPARKRVDEVVLHHQLAARHVDQHGSRLHRRELRATDHVTVRSASWAMQRNDVAARQ